jgi:hypothetical protein
LLDVSCATGASLPLQRGASTALNEVIATLARQRTWQKSYHTTRLRNPSVRFSIVAMSSNILYLPFRKSAQLSLASTIRQYINTKYDQHPDMFKHDLEVIDALRRDAVNVREPHPSGIKKLQAYAGQLVWVGGKFPIDVSITRWELTAETDSTGRSALSSHGIPPSATTRNVLWCAITSSTS